jgi:hypothetical protein
MSKSDWKRKFLIYGPIAVSFAILAALVYPNLESLLVTARQLSLHGPLSLGSP